MAGNVYQTVKSPAVSCALFDMVTTAKPIDITVSAAGDCTIGYDLDFGYSNSYNNFVDRYGYEYPFKNVRDIFKNDDITVVNLETTFTNAEKRAEKEFKFKGKPEYVNILKSGFVDTVNISNNHIHDYLQKGFDDTISALKEAGIGFFGEDYKYIKEVKNIKIGFLGYTGWDNNKAAKDKISADIKKLKEECRIVVVNFLWGIERTNYPYSVQTDLGRFCIDSGADLVIGEHPHVIQGIETYKGKNIIYSMGNFSYGGHKNPPDKDAFIFQQKFRVSGKRTYPLESKVIPCSITSTSSYNNYQPTPLSGGEGDRVLNRLKLYSSALEYQYSFK
jgi:poly-gamma-glutamate synthesis protein (capsule biosynthesis protein)